MEIFDTEDQRILSLIESKPYKLYSITDLLPVTKESYSVKQQKVKELEPKLERLFKTNSIRKTIINENPFYYSPNTELNLII